MERFQLQRMLPKGWYPDYTPETPSQSSDIELSSSNSPRGSLSETELAEAKDKKIQEEKVCNVAKDRVTRSTEQTKHQARTHSLQIKRPLKPEASMASSFPSYFNFNPKYFH